MLKFFWQNLYENYKFYYLFAGYSRAPTPVKQGRQMPSHFFSAVYFAVPLLWTKKIYLNNILRRVKLKDGEKHLIVEMSSNRKAVFL